MTHRTHPEALGANPQHLAETRIPWRVSKDVPWQGNYGDHYEPAAAEPKLQGCSADHAVETIDYKRL